MKEKGIGHIVNIISACDIQLNNEGSLCAMYSGALESFTNSLRLELQSQTETKDIHVTCIQIGKLQNSADKNISTQQYNPTINVEYAAVRIIEAIRRNRNMLILPKQGYILRIQRYLIHPTILNIFFIFGKYITICRHLQDSIKENTITDIYDETCKTNTIRYNDNTIISTRNKKNYDDDDDNLSIMKKYQSPSYNNCIPPIITNYKTRRRNDNPYMYSNVISTRNDCNSSLLHE